MALWVKAPAFVLQVKVAKIEVIKEGEDRIFERTDQSGKWKERQAIRLERLNQREKQ